MFEISRFWTGRGRRSSGRTSCKWCVSPPGQADLQTLTAVQFLESFSNKHISSSEDRLEETKRKKLAIKCEKLVELMMVSGIPTASGYEERIRFSELEVIDRGANEQGLLVNKPDGETINGWEVNVAGVR